MPVHFKEFLFAILDLSLYERWNCLFSSRIFYLLFWIFPFMRDETASSLQGFLICYFGSFPEWEMKLPLPFKNFLFAILDLSLYERLYCLFSSRNSYLLFWIFPCKRDCTACSLQGFLICYFGSFHVWEMKLSFPFKEFLFAILDLSPVWEMKLPLLFKDFLVAILNLSLYERWSCLFPSRISFLLFWIFPCMRDETASSLQGFLICYFGSFHVWEMKMPLLFKDILFAISDLSMDERWNFFFSSKNSYLLFWIFPCMRDETANSLQGFLICYFGSFPVWEMKLPLLFKDFLFSILDLSLNERWSCLFPSRISYLLFWIFPCKRDCTACSLQGILICYFGSFPVRETVLRVLFKEFLFAILDLSPVWEMKLPFLFKDFLFAILDLSLYERWNCLFSSRISYLLFWIFPWMRDEAASSLQGFLICYFGSSLYERWKCLFSSRISYLLFWFFPWMRDDTASSLQRFRICYFGSFPEWEMKLPLLFKDFLFAILDISLYERLYCLFSSRNSYLLFWIFPCKRDCTACSLQGIVICYFGSFPVWEMKLSFLFKEFLFAIFHLSPVWEMKLPLLFKDFLVAILNLSMYERWSCLFPSRISFLLFWIFPCMRDETASSLQGFLICYFRSFPVWEMKMPLLFKDILFAILDLSLNERWSGLFSSRISYLLFWIFPMYERWNCLFSSRIS